MLYDTLLLGFYPVNVRVIMCLHYYMVYQCCCVSVTWLELQCVETCVLSVGVGVCHILVYRVLLCGCHGDCRHEGGGGKRWSHVTVTRKSVSTDTCFAVGWQPW